MVTHDKTHAIKTPSSPTFLGCAEAEPRIFQTYGWMESRLFSRKKNVEGEEYNNEVFLLKHHKNVLCTTFCWILGHAAMGYFVLISWSLENPWP